MRFCQVVAVAGFLLGVMLSSRATAADPVPAELLKVLPGALAGRTLAGPEEAGGALRLRGGLSLREIYRRTIPAVPLVVSAGGTGSAVVIAVNGADTSGWVVTNHHVVEKPFRSKQGGSVVVLLFYNALLASEPFDEQRLVRCVEAGGGPGWCDGLLRSMRIGVIVGSDPDRDLALLHVTNVPRGILPIHEAGIESVEPVALRDVASLVSLRRGPGPAPAPGRACPPKAPGSLTARTRDGTNLHT